MNTESLLTTLTFLGGGLLAYQLFSLLGFPLLFWLLRGRSPIESGGLRYAVGAICFSTLVYFFEICGLKISQSALLAIVLPVPLVFVGPWRRLRWKNLATGDLQPGALWPPVLFVAVTAFLFSKPAMQVFYEVWMYFSVERNVAFDLFPAINPGVLGETFEKSHGGYMITGGLAGLLGCDAKDVSVCCKLANVFAFFSLSRVFLTRFGAGRFMANTYGSLLLMVTGMTPLFLWMFVHVGSPALLKEGWGTKDVFRDIILPYSSSGGANAAFFTEIFHLFDNMLGVVLACAAAFIAVFYQGRRRAVTVLATLFWGSCLIYSMYGLELGAIIAVVILTGFVMAKSPLRRRLRATGAVWVVAGCVAAAGLLTAAGAQTEKTALATVAVLEGTYLGLKLLPHISNLLVPMGLLTPLILIAFPLYRWPIGRRATRMYWSVWGAVAFIVLFLRTVGGNNYKFAFVIPFLCLPMLMTLTERVGAVWRSRMVPYLAVAVTYAFQALFVSLLYKSQFADRTEYPIWSDTSERGRYLASIYPAFDWVCGHTPKDAYILIYPFALPGLKSTSVTNFVPSYGMRRRIVYLRDPMYTDPLLGAEVMSRLSENAYADDETIQLRALRDLQHRGHIYALATAEHPLRWAERCGQLVYETQGVQVFDLGQPPPSP